MSINFNKKTISILTIVLFCTVIALIVGSFIIFGNDKETTPSSTGKHNSEKATSDSTNLIKKDISSENMNGKINGDYVEGSSRNNKVNNKSFARDYLQSIIGDIENLPEGNDLKSLENDPVHLEWMLKIERDLGKLISPKEKRAIMEQHLKTLNVLNLLKEKYFADQIDWKSYVDGLKSLSKWDDEIYHKILTDAAYEKFNGFKKEEAESMVENLFTPPDTEVFVLFPEIKNNYSYIKTETDLYQKVSHNKVLQLIKFQKDVEGYELHLQKELNSGNLSEDKFFQLIEAKKNSFTTDARRILNPAEFKLLFGDVQEKDR